MPGRWLFSVNETGGPPRLAVLDVADGPGRSRDPALAALVRRLATAGTEVLGRVDTDFGLRAAADVRADLLHYRTWYGVRGAYLDQAAACADRLGHFRDLARGIPGTVVLNPGVYPDPGYAAVADVLVTFDGPLPAYRAFREPAWARPMARETFCHLIHGVGPRAREATLRRAARYAATVAVTSGPGRGPWDMGA